MRRLVLPNTLVLLAAAMLQACSVLPNYEAPIVTVTGLRMLPSEGIAPNFEIGLRIVNPNSFTLPIDGISYAIGIDGKDLIRGVGNDFPTIAGYGQADISISASADLLAGVRLFTDLLRSPRDSVDYNMEARLNLGGLRPSIRVRDEGMLSLNALRQYQ